MMIEELLELLITEVYAKLLESVELKKEIIFSAEPTLLGVKAISVIGKYK